MKAATLRLGCCVVAISISTFVLPANCEGSDTYAILHYFANHPASTPTAALVADSAGNLYATASGSSSSCGAVFKLTRLQGGGWGFSLLHKFTGVEGCQPLGSLIFDNSGNLFGTTFIGGTHAAGNVFELSPVGHRWHTKNLYSFGASTSDLQRPTAGVTFDSSGNLYGSAENGGNNSQGGVFELVRSTHGWKEKVLYRFTGGSDGAIPTANLVWDAQGNLYSTTLAGGADDSGAVFELTPTTRGMWSESVAYSFTAGSDGAMPMGGVVFDSSGNLFGTAYEGGSTFLGTVFELTPSNGKWNFNLLYTFQGPDGSNPAAGVTIDSSGNLYGTTVEETAGQSGWGNVFELSQSGGNWIQTVLHAFDKKMAPIHSVG